MPKLDGLKAKLLKGNQMQYLSIIVLSACFIGFSLYALKNALELSKEQ